MSHPFLTPSGTPPLPRTPSGVCPPGPASGSSCSALQTLAIFKSPVGVCCWDFFRARASLFTSIQMCLWSTLYVMPSAILSSGDTLANKTKTPELLKLTFQQ